MRVLPFTFFYQFFKVGSLCYVALHQYVGQFPSGLFSHIESAFINKIFKLLLHPYRGGLFSGLFCGGVGGVVKLPSAPPCLRLAKIILETSNLVSTHICSLRKYTFSIDIPSILLMSAFLLQSVCIFFRKSNTFTQRNSMRAMSEAFSYLFKRLLLMEV